MGEPAWTPGPWKVQLVKGSYQRPAFVEAAGQKVVAGCFGNQLEPDATSIREAEANANLIAAAPALYDALAALLAGADAGHVSVEVDNAARAALSLARSGRDGK